MNRATVLSLSMLFLGCTYNSGGTVQSNSQSAPVAASKTYVNTKYGYQVSYDSAVYIINPSSSAPISPNADNISLFKAATLNSPELFASLAVNAFPNPQRLSPEDFLKQNYQKWLSTSSHYTDFYINEPTTFEGLTARRFGTERDQYILVTKDDYALTISADEPALLGAFAFTK